MVVQIPAIAPASKGPETAHNGPAAIEAFTPLLTILHSYWILLFKK